MSYGFTAYEVQALKPKVVLVRERRPDYSKLGGIVLLVVLLGILFINTFLLPLTVVHADTKVLSDREQETTYCKLWATGTPTSGGTQSAVATHCNKYL